MPFGPDLSSQTAPLLPAVLLCLMAFLPALGAAAILVIPPRWTQAIKRTAMLFVGLDLALLLWYAIPASNSQDTLHFSLGTASVQGAFAWPVAPQWGFFLALGLDGISLPLALLASLVGLLAIGASWSLGQGVKTFYILVLTLQTAIVGALMALDGLLLLVFCGAAVLAATLLIGGWGGERRRGAAVKFAALCALSVGLIAAAFGILYAESDLRVLQRAEVGEARSNPEFMKTVAAADGPVRTFNLLSLANIAHTLNLGARGGAEQARHLEELAAQGKLDGRKPAEVLARLRQLEAQSRPPSPFTPAQAAELTQLSRLARPPLDSPFDKPLWGGKSVQWWAFVLLFAGLAIQLAVVPLHAWIAGAQAEASTPVAMILAGGLVKVAGCGLARIAIPVCPAGVDELLWLVLGAGLLSMVYGAVSALRQRALNRRIAWSSVSFMGYVVFGLGLVAVEPQAAPAVQAAMFQLVAHGLIVAGLFFAAGMMRDRAQDDSLNLGGGWLARMPLAGMLALGVFAAATGLPVLSWFMGQGGPGRLGFAAFGRVEMFALAAGAAALLTAATLGWTTLRVFFANRDKASPTTMALATRGELGILAAVLVLAVLLGAMPQAITAFLGPTVAQHASQFQEWKALKAQRDQVRGEAP